MFDSKSSACLIFILSVALFLGSIHGFSYAQESDSPSPPRIIINMGNGRVEVESQGLELSAETLQKLQTELMVNDQLSPAVVAEEVTRLELSGPEIDRLQQLISQHSGQIAEQIQGLVFKQSGVISLAPDPENENDQSVVLNENVTVGPQDFRSELVVIGGHAFVQGTVGVLIVVGGDAHVFSGGRVLNETVVLGGRLEVEPGGRVSSSQTVLSAWNVWPWMRHHVIDWWSYGWVKIGLSLLAWLWAWTVVWLLENRYKNFFRAAEHCWSHHKLASFSWGLAFLFALFPATALLALSVIGLILVPVMIGLLILWILVGYAVLLRFVGKAFKRTQSWRLSWQLLLAQSLWLVLGFVPIAGFGLRLLLILIAMGAVACACSPLRLTQMSPGSTNEV